LRVGVTLDRARLRVLRRELRRSEALDLAGRTLRRRDLSRRALEERLAGHVAASACEEALAALARAGVVDDERVAASRAVSLADRGYGDAAIRHDLRCRGLDPVDIDRAVGSLEPEAERAAAIVSRRGNGPKTARSLAAKGFSDEAVAAAVSGAFATDP
jgi:SOS response regulatory protein OraA/RecX